LAAAAPWIAGAGMVLLFFGRLLSPARLLYFRDLQTLFLGQKFFLARCLRAGEFPFWNPHVFCGAPFASDLQSGAFYPLSLVFLLPSFPAAMNAYVLLHLALVLYFTRGFLRSQGAGEAAAAYGTVAFVFGGYVISSLNILNNFTTLAWMPGVLWAFQRFQARPGPWRFTIVLGGLALEALAGEPQILAFTLGLLVLLAIVPGKPRTSLRAVPALGWIALLAAGMAAVTAVQCGPAITDFRLSVRSAGLSYGDAAAFAVSPASLPYLVRPFRLPGELMTDPRVLHGYPGYGEIPNLLTVYSGMLTLPLAVFGMVRRRSPRAWMWAAVFPVGVILCMGAATPLFAWVHAVLPFLRYPSKFLLPADLALVVLAARGVDALPARPRGLPVLLGLALAADLYLAHGGLNPTSPAARLLSAEPSVPVPAASAGLRTYVDDADLVPLADATTIEDYQTAWQRWLVPNIGVVEGVDYVNGVGALELRSQWVITETLRRPWFDRIRFLRLAGTEWVASPVDLLQEPDMQIYLEPGIAGWYRVRDPLPRAWIAGRLVELPEDTAALAERGAFPLPQFEPGVAAWVSPGTLDVAPYRQPYCMPATSVEKTGNGAYRIHAASRLPGILVFTESHHPGWSATVDGAPVPVLRVDTLFLGVELPPGGHTVEFRFRPPGFAGFAGVSAAAVLLAVLVPGWVSGRRRRA